MMQLFNIIVTQRHSKTMVSFHIPHPRGEKESDSLEVYPPLECEFWLGCYSGGYTNMWVSFLK